VSEGSGAVFSCEALGFGGECIPKGGVEAACGC
jgi:hypothetical protein